MTKQRSLAWALMGLLPLLLSCVGGAATPLAASIVPRWACPSATPLPFGKEGPPKREWDSCETDPATGERHCTHHREDYQQWEREYGLPPVAPTPFTKSGTSYYLGQRVQVGQLYALVSAGKPAAGIPLASDRQVYLVDVAWNNPGKEALPIDYVRQLTLRAVRRPDGRIVSDGRWSVEAAALKAAGLPATLPQSIPPGESQLRLAIAGPPGTIETLELRLSAQGMPLVVQWANSHEPECSDPGATTPWGDGPMALAPPPPPGTARVVKLALAQVGKPYVWGAVGPNSFDCSGLMQWSYGQIGISIPRTTYTQFPALPPVDIADAQPGDLIYFAGTDGSNNISHVGMFIGDIDGDGRGDMVHAATEELGVRIESNVFGTRYWQNHFAGLRRVEAAP